MKFPPTVICLILAALCAGSSLDARNRVLEFFSRKADRVEDQKVERQVWTSPVNSSLRDKTFPIKEWNKHFSSLGSKRAPIALDEKQKKERFEVKVLDRQTVDFDMSEWNERMANLHKRAAIQLDEKAQIAADRQIYNMMLQDRQSYREMAAELSLRDLNRFQFRRNRSPDTPLVQKAGGGE